MNIERRTSVFIRLDLAMLAKSGSPSLSSSGAPGVLSVGRPESSFRAVSRGSSRQLAPTSHHFPFLVESWISAREMLMGSEARIVRELLREPRILRILVMCSDVMLEPDADFILLFFRSVMVSIINFVRTDRDCSPIFPTAGCIRRTMSFKEEGSSCRS